MFGSYGRLLLRRARFFVMLKNFYAVLLLGWFLCIVRFAFRQRNAFDIVIFIQFDHYSSKSFTLYFITVSLTLIFQIILLLTSGLDRIPWQFLQRTIKIFLFGLGTLGIKICIGSVLDVKDDVSFCLYYII